MLSAIGWAMLRGTYESSIFKSDREESFALSESLELSSPFSLGNSADHSTSEFCQVRPGCQTLRITRPMAKATAMLAPADEQHLEALPTGDLRLHKCVDDGEENERRCECREQANIEATHRGQVVVRPTKEDRALAEDGSERGTDRDAEQHAQI